MGKRHSLPACFARLLVRIPEAPSRYLCGTSLLENKACERKLECGWKETPEDNARALGFSGTWGSTLNCYLREPLCSSCSTNAFLQLLHSLLFFPPLTFHGKFPNICYMDHMKPFFSLPQQVFCDQNTR